MPYKITWLDSTVIIDFFGDVTTQEIREHGMKVNDDPRFKNVRKRISNCSKIKTINASSSDLKIFGMIDHNVAALAPSAHMAVVSRAVQIKRNTELYRDAFGDGNWKIELFDTVSDALAWDPESQ